MRTAGESPWLHWAHDRLGIAGGGPGPAARRVFRCGGRASTLRPGGRRPARRAAVVEPADSPAGAAAGCPVAGPHTARHAAHGCRRGVPAAGQGAVALGGPSDGAGPGRRAAQPHHHRLHGGPDYHPGGARVAPRAPRRRCASHAPGLGSSLYCAARPSSGRGRDPAAVPYRPAARDRPLRRASGAGGAHRSSPGRQGIGHPRRHRRRADASGAALRSGLECLLAHRPSSRWAPSTRWSVHRCDRRQVRTHCVRAGGGHHRRPSRQHPAAGHHDGPLGWRGAQPCRFGDARRRPQSSGGGVPQARGSPPQLLPANVDLLGQIWRFWRNDSTFGGLVSSVPAADDTRVGSPRREWDSPRGGNHQP